MATLDNAAVAREVIDAFNKKDLDRLASCASADAKVTLVPFGTKLGFREDAENWARAFPDGELEVTSLVGQGDTVICELTARGTHQGALKAPTGDIPATGRRVEMGCVQSFRLRNGKIVESRVYFDTATMLAQLGLSAGAPATQAQARTATQEQRH
jgi:steroid delta-isomerase-like uncharacterized protein